MVGVGMSLSAFSGFATQIPSNRGEKMEDFPAAPTSTQMKAFQNGEIQALSKYIGSTNTVVLAFRYLTRGEDVKPDSFNGTLVHYYRVISSSNPKFKSGQEFIRYIAVENGAKTITSKYRKEGDPKIDLVYLFNLEEIHNLEHSGQAYSSICDFERIIPLKSQKKRDYETLQYTLKFSK